MSFQDDGERNGSSRSFYSQTIYIYFIKMNIWCHCIDTVLPHKIMPIFPPTHSNSVVYGTQIYNRNKYVCLFQQLLGKSHPEKSPFLRFQSYVSSLSSAQYVVSPKHFCIF